VWSRFLVGFARSAPRIYPPRTRRRTRQVRYIPDLLSLSEARELAIASGHSMSEAETDICRALREKSIRSRRAFERVTFRGYTVDPELFGRMAFEDGNRFSLARAGRPGTRGPWENSRPRKPWPLGEGYFAHIARLELSRRDLERVLSLVEAKTSNEALGEASQADAERKRAEAKWKRRLTKPRGSGNAWKSARRAQRSKRLRTPAAPAEHSPAATGRAKRSTGPTPRGPEQGGGSEQDLRCGRDRFCEDQGMERRRPRHHPPRSGPAQIGSNSIDGIAVAALVAA